MGGFVLPITQFWHRIVDNSDFGNRNVWLVSFLIAAISSSIIIALGAKGFIAIILPLILYCSLRYNNFLLYIFLLSAPLVLSLRLDLASIFIYGIVLLIIAIWAARKMIFRKNSFVTSQILLIFMFTVVFFSIISVLPGGINRKELYAVVRLIIFFILVLVLYDSFRPRDATKVFISMTIPLVVSSYFIILIYVRAATPMAMLELYRYKATGFFVNANLFGLILISVIPFWIANTIWLKNNWARILSGAITLLLSLSLILTNSRAAIVGFFISVFLFSIWAKKVKYLLVAAITVGVLIFSIPQIKAIGSVAFRLDRGTSYRIDVWSNTLQMVKENFLFGVGFGNYSGAYDRYFATAQERGFFITVPHAHNFILSKMAEFGIVGLFFALTLYYLPVRSGIRLLKKTVDRKDRMIVFSIMAAMGALYGQSIFEGGGMLQEARIYPDIIFWLLFVMLLKTDALLTAPASNIYFDNNANSSEREDYEKRFLSHHRFQ